MAYYIFSNIYWFRDPASLLIDAIFYLHNDLLYYLLIFFIFYYYLCMWNYIIWLGANPKTNLWMAPKISWFTFNRYIFLFLSCKILFKFLVNLGWYLSYISIHYLDLFMRCLGVFKVNVDPLWIFTKFVFADLLKQLINIMLEVYFLFIIDSLIYVYFSKSNLYLNKGINNLICKVKKPKRSIGRFGKFSNKTVHKANVYENLEEDCPSFLTLPAIEQFNMVNSIVKGTIRSHGYHPNAIIQVDEILGTDKVNVTIQQFTHQPARVIKNQWDTTTKSIETKTVDFTNVDGESYAAANATEIRMTRANLEDGMSLYEQTTPPEVQNQNLTLFDHLNGGIKQLDVFKLGTNIKAKTITFEAHNESQSPNNFDSSPFDE